MTPSEQAEPDPSVPPRARIVRIVVKKLYGFLDHDVLLRADERVTIVHGVNGVGKTKLLELTAALTRGRLPAVLDVPFEELRLDLDDGTAISVLCDKSRSDLPQSSRTKYDKRGRSAITIRRLNSETSEVLETWAGDEISESVRVAQRRMGLPPWIEHFGQSMWRDTRSDLLLTSRDVAARYGVSVSMLERSSAAATSKFNEIVRCLPAHLIETQRLLRIGARRVEVAAPAEEAGSLVMTVHELAAELKQNIGVAQGEFFRTTQALDRTLTERVLQAQPTNESSGEKLRVRLETLATHRERLERVGLLDAGTFGPTLAPAAAESLSGDRALMIAVHTEDAEQKFKVLDPLATRLELLLNGINEKLALPKRLALDRDQNLTVRSHGTAIPLDQLSSGEQHELVLLYDLVFRVRPNTLVLIDEPELSLHPAWQQQFLDDIIKIARNGSFDVLLATHSPYIVGSRSDLCVELKAEARA